jgi:hypothetical protein
MFGQEIEIETNNWKWQLDDGSILRKEEGWCFFIKHMIDIDECQILHM